MFFHKALQVRSLEVQLYFTMNCKACYRIEEDANGTESGLQRKKGRYFKDYSIFVVCLIRSHIGHAFEL